jgi:hypothetical protein
MVPFWTLGHIMIYFSLAGFTLSFRLRRYRPSYAPNDGQEMLKPTFILTILSIGSSLGPFSSFSFAGRSPVSLCFLQSTHVFLEMKWHKWHLVT